MVVPFSTIGPMCGGLNYVWDDVTRWCIFSESCVWLFVI